MSTETMLTVESLRKSTDDGIIFSELTLSIPKKGIHGLLAPNGAGKTALLNILAGWDDDFEGEILLGEASLGRDALTRKKRIGFLPAVPALDPSMTVEEITVFAGRAKQVPAEKLDARVKEALDLVGLSHVSRRLCGNLTPFERRKLSVAIALVGNPRLILLDEPTRNLGRAEAREMWELIRVLGEVKTVLVATDRYEEAAELCEDVILMADGRILASGTLAELEEQLVRKQGAGGMNLSAVYASLSGVRKEGRK